MALRDVVRRVTGSLERDASKDAAAAGKAESAVGKAQASGARAAADAGSRSVAADAGARAASGPAGSAGAKAAEGLPAEPASTGGGEKGFFDRVMGTVRPAGRKAGEAAGWGAAKITGAVATGVASKGAMIMGGAMIADAALIEGRDMLARKVFGDQAVDIQNLAATGSASVTARAETLGAEGALLLAGGKIGAALSGRGVGAGSLVGDAIGVFSSGKGGRSALGTVARAGAALGGAGVAAYEAGPIMDAIGSVLGISRSAAAGGTAAASAEAAGAAAADAAPSTAARAAVAAGPAASAAAAGSPASGRTAPAADAPFPADARFLASGPMHAIDAGSSMQIGRIDARAAAGNAALRVGAREAAFEAARPVAYAEGVMPDGSSYFLMGRREPGPAGTVTRTFAAESGPSGAGISVSSQSDLGNGAVQRTIVSRDPSLVAQTVEGASPGAPRALVLKAAGQIKAAELGRSLDRDDPAAALLAASGLTRVRAQVVQTVAAPGVEPSSAMRFTGVGPDGKPVRGSVDASAGQLTLGLADSNGRTVWSSRISGSDVTVSNDGAALLSGDALSGVKSFLADPEAARTRGGPESAAASSIRDGVTGLSLALPSPREAEAAARSIRLAGQSAASAPAGLLGSHASAAVSIYAATPGAETYVLPRDPSFSTSEGRISVRVASVPVEAFPRFARADPRLATASDALGLSDQPKASTVGVAEGMRAEGSSYLSVGLETGPKSQRLLASLTASADQSGGSITATTVSSSARGAFSKSATSAEPGLVSQIPGSSGGSEAGGATRMVGFGPSAAGVSGELVAATRRDDPLTSALMAGEMSQVRGSVSQVGGTDAHATLAFAGRAPDGAQVSGAVDLAQGYGKISVFGPDGKTPVWSKEMDGKGVWLDRMGNVSLTGKDAEMAASFLSDPQAFVERDGPRREAGRILPTAPSSNVSPAPVLGRQPDRHPLIDPQALTGVAALVDTGAAPSPGRSLARSSVSGPAPQPAAVIPSSESVLAAWVELGAARYAPAVDRPGPGRQPQRAPAAAGAGLD